MVEFEELNTKYFNEVTKAVNALVDSKVAVHAHDKVLDDQIDDFKNRLTVIEGNIHSLEQENVHFQRVIAESNLALPIDTNNIEEHCKAQNPLSQRLIKFQCKVNALDDAMGIVKKAFDSDKISLDEYLRTIRALSKKQCKTIIKINKLISGTTGPNPQDMRPGMLHPPMGAPMMPPPGAPTMPPGGQPGMMQAQGGNQGYTSMGQNSMAQPTMPGSWGMPVHNMPTAG